MVISRRMLSPTPGGRHQVYHLNSCRGEVGVVAGRLIIVAAPQGLHYLDLPAGRDPHDSTDDLKIVRAADAAANGAHHRAPASAPVAPGSSGLNQVGKCTSPLMRSTPQVAQWWPAILMMRIGTARHMRRSPSSLGSNLGLGRADAPDSENTHADVGGDWI